jgi:hypothetical protein
MRNVSLCLAAAALVWIPGAAQADGLLYQLPKDGSWARYVVETPDGPIDASLTMASVGRETVDGHDCRWIEVKLEVTNDSGTETWVLKCLVPERHLGRGKDPLSHVVRAWHKRSADEPAMLTNLAERGILPTAIGGPLQEAAELDQEVVRSKLGELACKGITGYNEFQDGETDVRVTYRTRLNEKAPFGVVNAMITLETRANGQVTQSRSAKVTLSDYGETALSELPGFE